MHTHIYTPTQHVFYSLFGHLGYFYFLAILWNDAMHSGMNKAILYTSNLEQSSLMQ